LFLQTFGSIIEFSLSMTEIGSKGFIFGHLCLISKILKKNKFSWVISSRGGFSPRMIEIAYKDSRLVSWPLWALFAK
jgi:hypothetical protein